MRTETKLLKPLLQVVAVSLSLFVGWSRIADNKHFLTDVLAGFVLGAVFAWFVVSRALTFAVIKPSSTTFAHCHVCCKFCPPVQEHDCLFWSIYFSSNTFKRFLPLKTALFRERKPGRDTLRAKVSLLYGFVRLQSRLRRLSFAYEQREKKKLDKHPAGSAGRFLDCEQSLISFLSKVTARETQARERRSREPR